MDLGWCTGGACYHVILLKQEKVFLELLLQTLLSKIFLNPNYEKHPQNKSTKTAVSTYLVDHIVNKTETKRPRASVHYLRPMSHPDRLDCVLNEPHEDGRLLLWLSVSLVDPKHVQ